MNILDLFQGIATLLEQDPAVAIMRIVLIGVGLLIFYLGAKGTLEPLVMVPMGLGMSAVNAGVLFYHQGKQELFLWIRLCQIQMV